MGIFDRYLERIERNIIPNYVEPRFKLDSKKGEDSRDLIFNQLLLKLRRQKSETWFIYSPAGSGKTTLIWQLMYELLATDEETACIRINKKNLGNYISGENVHEFINARCPNTVDADLWKSRSRKQKAKIVIFIDAINEIYTSYKDTEQWQFILNLLEGNHRFCVLATSRHKLEEIGDEERDIEYLNIQPLKAFEIEGYLNANNLPIDQTINHISAAGLIGAASNPFLLSLITQFSQTEESKNHSDWPHSRAELLQKTWTTRLSKQHLEIGLSNQALLSCVSLISFIFGDNKDFIPLSNVTSLLDKVWGENKDLVAKARNHLTNHHLVQIHENSYQLIHDSLIELGLAQLYIEQDSNKIPLIALETDKLDTFIGDWVALHNNPNQAAIMAMNYAYEKGSPNILIDIIVANNGILAENTLNELWTNIGYGLNAGRLLSNKVILQLQLQPIGIIKQGLRYGLLKGFKKSPPWILEKIKLSLLEGRLSVGYVTRLKLEYKRSHFKTLPEKENNKKHHEKNNLINILTNSAKSNYDRRSSAINLSKITIDADITALLLKSFLNENTEHSIRGACATALGNIGDNEAVDALSKALLKDDDSAVRGSCATALGNIGDKRTVNALSRTLLIDENPAVRGSCATALGNIGDKEAVDTLSNILLKDKHSNVRGSCATALGSIGDKAAVDALSRALLEDENPTVRGSCATALGNIGNKGAIDALSKVLLKDDDSVVRGSCATALGNIGDKGAVDVLSKALLEDEDSFVQGSCAAALGKTPLINDQCRDSLEKAFFSSASTDRVKSRIVISYVRLFGQLNEQFYTYNFKRRSDGSYPNKKLQGKIVELVATNNPDYLACKWLNNVARMDFDYRNRTMAVKGLDSANSLSDELIRYIIDPNILNTKGKQRDTDNGVLGVTADAVIRKYVNSSQKSKNEELLNLVIAMFLEQATYSFVFIPSFASIRKLPLNQAAELFDIFEKHIKKTHNPNTFFTEKLEKEKQILKHHKQVANELDRLIKSPASFLKIYRDKARPEIEKHLSNEVPLKIEKPKIAIITVTDTESKTFTDYIKQEGYTFKRHEFRNRFYHHISINKEDGTNLDFIRVQPTDKGAHAAQALVNDLLEEFNLNYIFMVGICAGFPERKVAIGDVIIANQVFNYERSRLIDGDYKSQPQSYRCSPKLINLSKVLDSESEFDKHLNNKKLRIKDYACGDKVIADQNSTVRKKILEISNDIIALEMEASGMLHSIWENVKDNTNINVSMIKAASDLADDEMRNNKKEKQQAAMQAAIGVTLTLLKNL